MDGTEISAFAAHSAHKIKKKNGNLSLKLKSKNKLKKKNKIPLVKNVDSVATTVLNGTMPSSLNDIGNDDKQNIEKRKLIKSLLKAKRESIFKGCNLTKKVDNVFLDENGFSNVDSDSKRMSKNLENITVKKAKKRKLSENDYIDIYENSETDGIHSSGNSLPKENEVKNSNKFGKQGKKGKSNLPKFIYSDSVKVGEKVFSWMLSPLDMKSFFDQHWEQKPLHIRHQENFFNSICTMKDFKKAIAEHEMYFTKNIDVTSYVDGKRKTENPEGMAKPSRVWSLFREGKSIRLLNPQTFIPNIRLLNSTLQEFFQCFVGANIYLTPPGTQGFAPHYDDIDAFVLQLEGEKHWRLYNPRSQEEVLPRESSVNFSEEEIGEPIFEITLQPGDLLYFPRGIIHQARCLPHTHSLHITVSCCQKTTWADLLETVLPVALQKAISENAEFRKSLPIGYLNHLGMVHCEQETAQRRELIRKFEELAQTVLDHCPLDAGVDQLGASFVHDALPPSLSEEEKIHGADRNVEDTGKSFLDALENYPDKNLGVKLIRATCVRLVSEEDEMVLYYTTDNTLVYRENEAFSVTVRTQWAQAIEHLIHSYPKFVEMKELPVSNKLKKPGKWKHIAELVYFLWEKGLLLFDRPFPQIYR